MIALSIDRCWRRERRGPKGGERGMARGDEANLRTGVGLNTLGIGIVTLVSQLWSGCEGLGVWAFRFRHMELFPGPCRDRPQATYVLYIPGCFMLVQELRGHEQPVGRARAGPVFGVQR